MYVGKKVTRVDAHDKAMGRTRYTDDLCDKSAYVIRILHSTIANGRVISIDTSEAEKIPGVVKIFTCFDLKEKHYYPDRRPSVVYRPVSSGCGGSYGHDRPCPFLW